MNVDPRVVDARGLPCPQPVIALKKAIEEGGAVRIEVIVDNASARENVKRFASHSGNEVLAVSQESGAWNILVGIGSGAAAASALTGAAESCEEPESDSSMENAAIEESAAEGTNTILIRSDSLGQGDPELGKLLMRGFIAALAETVRRPKRLVLMNTGVRLAALGSDALSGLRALGSLGIEVMACGACLRHYGLEESLAAGRVTNMLEIAEFVLEGRVATI